MANNLRKISDLPSASTPLSGGELFEISQKDINGKFKSRKVSLLKVINPAQDDHNELKNIQGGDVTLNEYYHLPQAYHALVVGDFYTLRTETASVSANGLQQANDYTDTEILSLSASMDEHNELKNIQGGAPNEYYHLTLAQLAPISGGVVDHNALINLQGGVPSAGEYYHLSQAIHDGLFSGSPLIGMGSKTGTRVEVDYGNDIINAIVGVNTMLTSTDEIIQIGKPTGARLYVDGYDDERIRLYDRNNVGKLFLNQNNFQLGGIDIFIDIDNANKNVEIRNNLSSDSFLHIHSTSQTLGVSGSTFININQNTDKITGYADGTRMITVDDRFILLGPNNGVSTVTDTGFYADQLNNRVGLIVAGNNIVSVDTANLRFGDSTLGKPKLTLDNSGEIAQLYGGEKATLRLTGDTEQRLGISNDSRIVLTPGSDLVQLYGGTTEVFKATPSKQIIGDSSDTFLKIQGSHGPGGLLHSFEFEANGIVMIEGTEGDGLQKDLHIGDRSTAQTWRTYDFLSKSSVDYADGEIVTRLAKTNQKFGGSNVPNAYLEADTSGTYFLKGHIGGSDLLYIDKVSQTLGVSGSSYVNVNQNTGVVKLVQGSNTILETNGNFGINVYGGSGGKVSINPGDFLPTAYITNESGAGGMELRLKGGAETKISMFDGGGVSFGYGSRSNAVSITTDGITIDDGAGNQPQLVNNGSTFEIKKGSTKLLSLVGITAQTLGVAGDSRIEVSQSGDFVDIYASNLKQIFATSTFSGLGYAGALKLKTRTDGVGVSGTLFVPGSTIKVGKGQIKYDNVEDDFEFNRGDGTVQKTRRVLTKTSNYTATDGNTVLVDATGGAVTITLDTEANSEITVKKIDSSGNDVVIQCSPLSGSIEGFSAISLEEQWEYVRVVSDGTDWFIVSANPVNDASLSSSSVSSSSSSVSSSSSSSSSSLSSSSSVSSSSSSSSSSLSSSSSSSSVSSSSSSSSSSLSSSSSSSSSSQSSSSSSLSAGWQGQLAGQWQERVANPYGTWDGVKWVSEEEPNVWLISIEPSAGVNWEVNYRPTKMRLALNTSDQFLMRLVDTNSNFIFSSLSGGNWYTYEDGEEVDLDFSNNFDIGYLYISNDDSDPQYNLTNIEFFFGSSSSSSSSTSVSSSSSSVSFSSSSSSSSTSISSSSSSTSLSVSSSSTSLGGG